MAASDSPASQRVLVALDTSAASLLALEIAADLAAVLRASLAGLYVEEADLLYAAGLPFVRLVRAQSGQLAPFTADELERHWRALAGLARDALARAADARRLAWSFEVVRGSAAQVMIEAARNAQLAGLGIGKQRPGQARLGSMAQAALDTGSTPLLLVPPQRCPGERWAALLDTPEGAGAVLRLVGTLAATPVPPLLLVTSALEIHCRQALEEAPGQVRLPQASLPDTADLSALFATLRTHRAYGLILAAGSPFARQSELERLLRQGGWPLLLVR